MWLRLQMRAAQGRSFWRLLRFLRGIRFQVRKRVLLGSERYVSTSTAGRILVDLIWVTLPSLIFALATATALLISDLYLPAANWQWAPIPLWRLEDRDTYATFLSTISGIGGVLIGLFYAGLTAVSSAAYSQAPGVLRSLLLREPLGRLYIRLLAYATFVALCLLAFYGIGFSPIRLAVPFLLLLSGIAILSFVQLGQHAFYFFDPTKLGGSVFVDFERWVKRATVASRFWDDPSFQNHANRQAEAALKTLATLADYSSEQKHLRSDALADLAISTVSLLYRYATTRQLIPSASKWYPSEYQHPDFYTAGDLKIDMAVKTGGSVEPISVAQADWVEGAALPVVYKAIETNLQENNDASVFRILDFLRSYIERAGELWEIEEAIAISEQIGRILGPVAFSAKSAGSDSPRWRLGLVEYLCLLPIATLLGFVKSLDKARLANIRNLLGAVTWEQPETWFRAGFPRFVLPTLEWFGPRLEFEVMAEGRVITPAWFIEQVVVKDYLNTLHKCVDLLLNANERLYASWHKTSVDAKHPWGAAVVLNRQGEYVVKLQIHFHKIPTNEAEYESAKALKDLTGWPSGQAESFKQRVIAIERDYEIAVAKEAYSLVGIQRRSDVPDFAGEFLARTARTVLEAITRNNVDLFRAVLPFFFQASIKKTTMLLSSGEATSDSERMQRFSTAMGPLLDLVELSGYAIVASELRESGEFCDACRLLWDGYLADAETRAKRLQFLIGALQMADMPGLVAPGEVLRTGWRMQVYGLLRDLPVEDAVLGTPRFGFHVEHRVQHASPLVRVLAAEAFPGFYRGIDVFVAMYFAALPGNEGLTSKIRSGELIDALRRESGRRPGGAGENSDEEVED